MDTKKRKREEYESDTVAYLRRGTITILDALDVQLPDVFAAEILPKLSLMDTLNLAQVSKAYRDSVWSVRGVQSLEAKIAAQISQQKLIIHNRQPMKYATKYGNLPAIRALLQSGVDVNEPLDMGDIWGLGFQDVTALWFASSRGHAAVVKELIEAGADVNVRATVKHKTSGSSFSDITPLHMAANKGHTPVVAELIRAGADVNIPSSDGTTPLMWAASNGHEACALALIQAGANVNWASTVTDRDSALTRLLRDDDEMWERIDMENRAIVTAHEAAHGEVSLDFKYSDTIFSFGKHEGKEFADVLWSSYFSSSTCCSGLKKRILAQCSQ